MRSVAFVIESMGGGGAQSVVATLARHWCEQGRPVTVITFRGPEHDRFKLDPRVARYVIGGANSSRNAAQAVLRNVGRAILLRRTVRICGAEVVIGMVGSTNVLTILATLGMPCRVIVSERNDPSRQSLGRAWDMLRRITYRWADLVTANSRAATNVLTRYVPGERIVWLPNPIRLPEGGACELSDRPTVLAIGRLHRQKGFDVLLDAFARFRTSFPEWRLAIIGEGSERGQLEAQARDLGLENDAIFPGYADNPFHWYCTAQIFVQPSRYEGAPNAVLEAMACSLCCVVTDAQPGVRDFLEDGVSGFVVPVDHPNALAEALARLASDPARRAQIGARAAAAVTAYTHEKALVMWSATVDTVD